MKEHITNRNGNKIAVIVEEATDPSGVAFVMHGQGGFKEQPHIQMFADVFKANKYTAVRFDTRDTIGESEGNMEDASITSYYKDLEDVIAWAKTQSWYQEPFVLMGHSLGGICTALYAENHPDRVKAVAPISTVVSGKLSFEAHKSHNPDELEEWKKTGWQVTESTSKPGVVKRLKWSSMEDRLKYDLLEKAANLTMPVLLIVGENDYGTPPEHQKILHDKIPGKKELHVIANAPHTFKDPEHLSEIRRILDAWIKSL